MNINNNGQFLTKPAVQTGEKLPNPQPGLPNKENPFVSEIVPVAPSYGQISPIVTRPAPNQPTQPIKPDPIVSRAEATNTPVDLSNMMPREFRELIHSELSRERHESGGTLDVMPHWRNSYGSMFQDMARVADGSSGEKMNMLAIMEKAIETNIDKNQPVALLENTLARLKEINGQAIPNSINLSA